MKKKRILIDATTVIEKEDGLSQYIISLLDNLPAGAFQQFEFLVLVNKDVRRPALWAVLDPAKFTIIKAKVAPIGPKRDWHLYWFFKKHKKEFDLFHSTSNQYPLFLKGGIATVHDITFKKYLNSSRWSFNMASRFLDKVIRTALRNSAAVVAVSNATKSALVNTYHLNEAQQHKINVIYEGWEHLRSEFTDTRSDEAVEVGANYLFYVGTTRVHKNIKNLLKAFAIAKPDLPAGSNLVVSGNETYLDAEDLEIINTINKSGKRVFFTGFVSKNSLARLFR